MYRLSQEAKSDLLSIARYGDARFGVKQSDRYRDLLKQRFEQIAESPFMYQKVEYIKKGLRRSVCGVHSIYYYVEDDGIYIVRVLRSQEFNS